MQHSKDTKILKGTKNLDKFPKIIGSDSNKGMFLEDAL